MKRLIRLFHTSIGHKLIMALSGTLLVLFLLGHMAGNLFIYQGQNMVNTYAHWLQGHPLLWGVRLGLLAILLFHVVMGVYLARDNRAARPQPYQMHAPLQKSFAERHVLFSGLIILAFLLFHLAHLTLGWVDAEHALLLDEQGRSHVYAKLVLGFQNIWISGLYLLGLSALGLHLHHAIQSIFQTLGLVHDNFRELMEWASIGLSAVILLGLASIPIAVLLGWVS